ncbi:MAG: outer membrane protein transport protein [Candidatus Dactylopiibacterium sp.]|nr:outer membrane protein transport protein [Candidatus Dactylopiibacterium sp.]
MEMKKIARLVGLLGCAGFAGHAAASGFQLLEQNASGLGNAYAGSAASAENASVQFYNPAALTELPGGNVSAGLTLIRPSFRFRDTGSSNAPAAAGGNGGDAGGIEKLPNFYASWQLADRWFAGLGMGAPFGLKTDYEPDWAGRFQTQLFEIKTYNVNPSLAFKATEKLSVGVGLNYQRLEALYQRQAATMSPLLPSSAWPAVQNTQVTLDATGEAWGWNAGVLFKPAPATTVGFSYRSKMFYNLGGTLKSTNQLVSPDAHATADLTLPDTYILSVAQKLDERWEMLGDISRTNWSSVNEVPILRANGTLAQTLETRFRDTWRVALGGTYKVNDQWKWKYGVAYDQSPVRGAEERLLSLPDNNRYWLTTGVQWAADKTTTLDLGMSYIYIPDTKVHAEHTSAGQGRVVGNYDGSIILLGAQLSKRF